MRGKTRGGNHKIILIFQKELSHFLALHKKANPIFQKELQFLCSKNINFVGFHFRKSCNKTSDAFKP